MIEIVGLKICIFTIVIELYNVKNVMIIGQLKLLYKKPEC
ncbi:MAG: hypothetical protein ACI8WT_002734 [Clostridium sp.]|jgi:hypothetical protein